MSFPIRLSLAIISLMVPVSAAAATPGNVTGIKAALQNGKVLVSWTPITDQKIASYRVFFSHASILKQGGLYDDYETVEGTVNNFLIPNTPPVDMLFVSVLAVDDLGLESPYFAEEASVNLKSGETSKTSSTIAPPDTSDTTQTNASVLQLLGVQTLSATGVQLTFSQAVTLDPASATNAFTIKTASGKALVLTRLAVNGNTVVITTQPQERGTVYAVIINDGITGKDPTGIVLPLDLAQAPMLFSGDASGVTPGTYTDPEPVAQTEPIPATTGLDASNVRLRAQAEEKGSYTVEATWQIPVSSSLTGFQVFQTIDGGNSYNEGTNLTKTTGGVTVPHVPAGTYGLFIRAIYADGSMSRGVLQSINLPGAKKTQVSTKPKVTVATATEASVLQKPRTSTHLPQTGTGLIVTLLMVSSIASYAVMKQKKSALA